MNLNLNEKRVAIIGAGVSGLISAKETRARGLNPVVFELKNEIGGLWSNIQCGMWDSLITNVSKYSTCMSDFYYPQEENEFPNKESLFNFLKSYCQHFDLYKHIRFNSKVINVKKLDETGKYLVTFEILDIQNNNSKISNSSFTEIFDFVIVTTGFFSEKMIPESQEFEGLKNKSFKGEVIHSLDYKNPKNYINKKVVIVGSSFSANEIALDIINQNNSQTDTSIVFNRPSWMIPRYFKSSYNKMIPIDLAIYSRVEMEKSKNIKKDEKNFKSNLFLKKLSNDQDEILSILKWEDFNEHPRVSFSDNQKFIEYVKSEKIKLYKTKPVKFEGNTIYLENGESIQADVIILCTGFKCNLNFLDEEIMKIIEYDPNDTIKPFIADSTVFHPDLPNFGFVGMYKGIFFIAIELHARLVSMVFSGEIKQLDRVEMLKNLVKDREIRKLNPRPQFPHLNHVEIYDSLAERIGVLPNLEEIKITDNKLYYYLYNGPILPQHYRLVGIDSEYDRAYKEIERINKIYIDQVNNL
jgi:dimethylaniline monooxygenase (N-oxide forming)